MCRDEHNPKSKNNWHLVLHCHVASCSVHCFGKQQRNIERHLRTHLWSNPFLFFFFTQQGGGLRLLLRCHVVGISRSASKASVSQRRGAASSPLESPESGVSSARLSFKNVVPSPESQADPGPSEDPSSLSPWPSTHGSLVQDQPLEEPEWEEDARSASDQDGDLTDASSAGESVRGTSWPVETVDLVDLQGQDRCRQIYIGKLSDHGSKGRLCCGRTVTECRQC
jgi:hypothetical protein